MKVTREQVLAWRLRRQFVDPRGEASAGEIVGRLCGVQAQVASAAELAVGLRQRKPEADAVNRALADGTLVKTWAMRGTLHLLPAEVAGAYLSLIAAARIWVKPAWKRAFGASPEEIAELGEAVSALLDGAVLTRDELVRRLAEDRRFAAMEEHLRSSWGMLFKPLAWQGIICHGPKQGGKATFARPASLSPRWRDLPDPEEAAPIVLSAYLGAYGPATPETFDGWLASHSHRKTTVRRWFADMGDRLTEVDVEGATGYVLTEHADELARCEPSASVRLLGSFDQYVLGPGTKDTWVVPAEHRAKVSRTAGWISPIVVVGGRVAGTWELDKDTLAVSLFPDAERPPMDALEAEAAHVAQASGLSEVKVRVA